MDHLPVPVGTQPIKIPYIPAEPYDRGSFSGYPERQNWKIKSNGELDFELEFDSGEDPDEEWDMDAGEGNIDEAEEDGEDNKIDIFVQTWLYFGCLIEVFYIVGISVKQEDFIRSDNTITTEKLSTLIQEWKSRELSSQEGRALLESNHQTRDHQWESSAKRKSGRHILITKILDTVRFYTKKYCYSGDIEVHGPSVPSWFIPAEICLSIMVLGWTLKRAAHHIYQPGEILPRQNWGSSSILTGRVEKAGWCLGEVAKLMGDVEIDCFYFFGSLRSPREDQDHSDCTELGCSGKGIKEPYVTQHIRPGCSCAFSRVPIDRVVEIIREGATPLISWTSQSGIRVDKSGPGAQRKYVSISHVWSDGMGNENENALPECQLSRLQNMVAALYKNHADHQIPFWLDTLCVPVRSDLKPIRKQAIREMKNIYENAHRVLIIDSFIRALPRSASATEKAARLYLSNWQHRLWTLQEGLFAQELFFQFQDGPQTLDELRIEQKVEQETCQGLYSTIVGHALPHIPTINMQLRSGMEVGIEVKFSDLLNGIANRKTSNWQDETICIATLLDLGTKFLLNVREELRMETLLKTLCFFQQAIIFNEMPRLEKQGFRWAPKSFLSQSKSLWPRLKADISEKDRMNHLEYRRLHNYGGLHVRFQGLFLKPGTWSVQRKMIIVPRSAGNSRKSRETKYGLLILDWDKSRWWDPKLKYAVILSTSIDPSGAETACVLGNIEDKGDVIAFRHQSVARIKALSNERLGRTAEVQSTLAIYGTYFDGDVEDYDEISPVLADISLVSQEWRVI